MVTLLLAGCEYRFSTQQNFPADKALFIMTSDNISSSGFAVYDGERMLPGEGDFHPDAVVRVQYPYLYVINRLGRDNIQLLNIQDNYKTVAEIPLPGTAALRANPQDIVFVGDRALVSCYGNGEIHIFNTVTFDFESSIQTASYAYNGSSCPAYMHFDESGARVFVALQRLDTSDYLPADYSLILVVDSAAAVISAELRLQYAGREYTNPYTRFRNYDSDSFLIGCAGHFKMTGVTADDGGVLIFGGNPLVIEGVLVDESALAADIVDFVWVNRTLYAITLAADGKSSLIGFDPDTGELKTILSKDGKGYLWRIEECKGLLYVCCRDTADTGLLIYDTNKKEFLTTRAIATGLPPTDMVFVDDPLTPADDRLYR